jgi:putative membrane protein
MFKTNIGIFLKGLVVGSSMLVPGVSGGTTAIILGIYEKLIHAVSNFLKDIKKNLLFLIIFCIGAGVGILLFARLMLKAVETWELPMMFLFFGAILGSIPMLYRQANVKKFNPLLILFAIAGFAVVLSLSFFLEPASNFSGSSGFQIVMLFVTGMIIAIALVLPGISTSHMLLVLGMYTTTLEAIETLNFGFLIPLALGGIVGIFLTTKIIEKALTKFPQISYFTIIGFVLGSIISVFPGFPSGFEIIVCALTFMAGFIALFIVSKYSNE